MELCISKMPNVPSTVGMKLMAYRSLPREDMSTGMLPEGPTNSAVKCPERQKEIQVPSLHHNHTLIITNCTPRFNMVARLTQSVTNPDRECMTVTHLDRHDCNQLQSSSLGSVWAASGYLHPGVTPILRRLSLYEDWQLVGGKDCLEMTQREDKWTSGRKVILKKQTKHWTIS